MLHWIFCLDIRDVLEPRNSMIESTLPVGTSYKTNPLLFWYLVIPLTMNLALTALKGHYFYCCFAWLLQIIESRARKWWTTLSSNKEVSQKLSSAPSPSPPLPSPSPTRKKYNVRIKNKWIRNGAHGIIFYQHSNRICYITSVQSWVLTILSFTGQPRLNLWQDGGWWISVFSHILGSIK